MPGSKSPTLSKSKARNRITNGKALLPRGADGRSLFVRRLRDLIALHTQDLGGSDNVSESEKAIVRRAAVIMIQLEKMEMRMATDSEDASANLLDLYQRLSNTMRRLLESVGLQRRAKDITPTLQDYIRQKMAEREAQTIGDDDADQPRVNNGNGHATHRVRARP